MLLGYSDVIISLFSSDICYNQLALEKLIYLHYTLSVMESLYCGSARVSRGRPPSEKKSELAPSKTILNYANEMYLSVKGKRRCAYCSDKETDFRSKIECATCKLSLSLRDKKLLF